MTERIFHCVICGGQISPERMTRKAVTCSAAHAAQLKSERRKLRDLTRCRLCNRPSTPEERASYRAWRKETKAKKPPKTKKKSAAAERREAEAAAPTPMEEAFGTILV